MKMKASEKNPKFYESSTGKIHIYIGPRMVRDYWSGRKKERKQTLCGSHRWHSDSAADINPAFLDEDKWCQTCIGSAISKGVNLDDKEGSSVTIIPETENYAISDGGAWRVNTGDEKAKVSGGVSIVAKVLGAEAPIDDEDVVFLPADGTFAVLQSGNQWDIFEDGKKEGSITGSEDLVRKVIDED